MYSVPFSVHDRHASRVAPALNKMKSYCIQGRNYHWGRRGCLVWFSEKEKKKEKTQGERGKKDWKPTSTSFNRQSDSCDLVKAHQEARDLVLLFQGIRADFDATFHDLYERSVSIANENDVLPTKTQSKRPVESIEDHIALITFFHSLIILYHI